MADGNRICSQCGLRRLTEAECPACGGQTYAPPGPATAAAAAATAPPAKPNAPLGGLLIALTGAAALLISLSLPWYAVDLPGGLRGLFEGAAEHFGLREAARGLEANAWQAFEIADVALAIAAGATFLLVTATLLGQASASQIARLLQLAGGFTIGVTVFRMVEQPGPAQLLKVEAGPWVALAAGAAIVLGSGLITARPR